MYNKIVKEKNKNLSYIMLYFCSCTKTMFLVVVVDIIPKNEKHLERATKALMKKNYI